MIAKGCPKCDQQVPVACKACPCGYSFFNARRTAAAAAKVPPAPKPREQEFRRRTQRVRREKPNYYDALEYEKQLKKTRARNSECDNNEDDSKRESTSSSSTSTSKQKKRKVKKEDEEDNDIITHLSPEKQVQCSIILAELNRKMGSVMWKP